MTCRPEEINTLGSNRCNSWYLKAGGKHYFYCCCGRDDIVDETQTLHYRLDHHCSRCGNGIYFDSRLFMAKNKAVHCPHLRWNIETLSDDQGWRALAYDLLPVYESRQRKVRLVRVSFATLSLHIDGGLSHSRDERFSLKTVDDDEGGAIPLSEAIVPQLYGALYQAVISSLPEKLSWLNPEHIPDMPIREQLQMLSFFLRFEGLRDVDYWFWKPFGEIVGFAQSAGDKASVLRMILNGRKEKSVRRSFYEGYRRAIAQRCYSYVADYSFTHAISDPNFLVSLLQIDPKIKYRMFQGCERQQVNRYLALLLAHYTQRAVCRLFTSLEAEDEDALRLLHDSIGMMDAYFETEAFRKVALNFGSIHDELVRIAHLQKEHARENRPFNYAKVHSDAQGSVPPFTFVLPKDTDTLLAWSEWLHNCMFGYTAQIFRGETVIYGVFREERLCYAVEIKEGSIVQALGKENQKICRSDRDMIERWFQTAFGEVDPKTKENRQ